MPCFIYSTPSKIAEGWVNAHALSGKLDLVDAKTLSQDFAGDCQNPVTMTQMPAAHFVGLDPRIIVRRARCRKCGPCRRARSWHWAMRAERETIAAPRTWFWTLTVAPRMRNYFIWLSKITKVPRDVLIWKEVKKTLDRINHRWGIRYLAVTERHQDGELHFHILMHEKVRLTKVGKRVRHKGIPWAQLGSRFDLRTMSYVMAPQWSLGFTRANLVKGRGRNAAMYAAKYMAKDASARIKASFRYGGGRNPKAVPKAPDLPTVH